MGIRRDNDYAKEFIVRIPLLAPRTRDEEDRQTRVSRSVNFWASIAWAAMVPIAFVFGWWESVPFIAACSIYANFASHVAAWRADTAPSLDRIEEKVDKLVEELM